ncbi:MULTISPECIES: hypothetical protein [Sediminibacillus]|uniref:hypothetical protein n=1 Tax=Sediminibacillus TaxID=482460 RepID=UPI001294F793|nr:hypothetical protein [Sediminibacillus terrae]
MEQTIIHIINMLLLLLLLALGGIMYFGMHFAPQSDPYTAEHIAVGMIFILWGLNYGIQLKLCTVKSLVASNLLLVCVVALYVFFIYYPITFLEFFVE